MHFISLFKNHEKNKFKRITLKETDQLFSDKKVSLAKKEVVKTKHFYSISGSWASIVMYNTYPMGTGYYNILIKNNKQI